MRMMPHQLSTSGLYGLGMRPMVERKSLYRKEAGMSVRLERVQYSKKLGAEKVGVGVG